MFKLTCVTRDGCYNEAAERDFDMRSKVRMELQKPEVVSVTVFEDGRCVAVHSDWANQP